MTAAATRNSKVSMPESLIERLYYYADNNPDHEAIVTPDITILYSQLADLVRAQVIAFRGLQISADSIIGIHCADEIQHLILCLAATHIGATSCTIPSHDSEDARQAIIDRCGITHVVDESAAVTLFQGNGSTAVITVPHPSRRAEILFSTSGSTGDPKLVIQTDQGLVAQAHRHIGSSQERFACLASIEHNFAKRHRLYCVAIGATNVFLSGPREELVATILSLSVNVLHVSAFQAQELLETPNVSKLSSIRLKLGGSHVPLALREKLRNNITRNLQAGYGTTETGAIAFTDPDDLNSGESVGKALPGIEIRVLSKEGRPLDIGEHGELVVRCKGMFLGYQGKQDLTAARFEKGWFYTGDIGYLDSEQRIHLCGRLDDMFVFNSMNIYPQDIESVIRQYPGVIDTAVIPRTSSVHGNIPVALVVFTGNTEKHLPALKKFVKKHVGLRSPRQFILVEKIPRNASGKISRLQSIKLPDKSDKVRSDIIGMLDSNTKSRLKPSLIAAFEKGESDISFRKLEMDSLARLEFMIALESMYDIVITPQQFNSFRRLGNVVFFILSAALQQKPEHNAVRSINGFVRSEIREDSLPHVVRLFRRILCFCKTQVQLHQALATLDNRLTPEDLERLYDWHCSGQLITGECAANHNIVVSQWLDETKRLMLKSGKQDVEPFVSRRVAPNATLFSQQGSSIGKDLMIFFPPGGARNLNMPNAVLLQHINAEKYDVLIVSTRLNEKYRFGAFPFDQNLREVINWLSRLDWIREYGHIRTLGVSAGAYTAVVAGCYLKTDMAVGVGGRFHRKRFSAFKNLDMIFTTWKVARKARDTRVLLSYATDIVRDCQYARVISRVSDGIKIGIKFPDQEAGHLFLRQLLHRGELASYLARTVLADLDDKYAAAK